MKNVIVTCIWLVIGLTLVAGSCPAQDELVIGFAGDYPPYNYAVGGKQQGICPEIVRHAAGTLGIKPVFKLLPWNRMLYLAQIGQLDAVMPLFRTDEREAFLFFPATELAFEKNAFFTKKEDQIQYSGDLKALIPYAIGVVENYSYGSAFDAADFLRRDESPDDRQLVEKFKQGRFKVGLGCKSVIHYYAQQLGIAQDIVYLNPLVTQSPLYIGFSKAKGHKQLCRDMDKAMAAFKQTEAYAALKIEYGLE